MTIDPRITPRRTIWMWSASVLAGAGGLALAHGFDEPVVEAATIRIVLAASLGLFALSRLLMLVPFPMIGARLRRWWPDFVLIAAAGVWWKLDRSASTEGIILQLGAGYSIAVACGAFARKAIGWLTEDVTVRPTAPTVRWCLLGGLILALSGGAVLSLPVCWAGSHPIGWDNTYDGQATYELAAHGLNCLFTATAALTGTGLTVHDVGQDFSRTGQVVILALMQVGGLAIVIIGAVVGWRLRQMVGWHASEDDTSVATLRRLIGFVCIVTLLIEMAGVVALWPTATSDSDDPLFAAVFHAVSSFCNVGLTLSRNSLIDCRGSVGVYAVICPLMVLGSIGGPVAYDLYRRATGQTLRVSRHTGVTLLVTLGLIVVGALLLFGIETTAGRSAQYQKSTTAASSQASSTRESEGTIVFTSENRERTRGERMRTMSWPDRATAAVFQSIASRTGGMRTVRLDEASISPASRLVLMAWMFIGGAVGGTAGGLRIIVVVLLTGAILFRGTSEKSPKASRGRVLTAAGTATAAMLILVGLTTMVLVYLQPASMEACLSEAISACCNVGLTSGLTSSLPLEDRMSQGLALRIASRSMLILAMLLGRILPIGILLRSTRGFQNMPSPRAGEDQGPGFGVQGSEV